MDYDERFIPLKCFAFFEGTARALLMCTAIVSQRTEGLGNSAWRECMPIKPSPERPSSTVFHSCHQQPHRSALPLLRRMHL